MNLILILITPGFSEVSYGCKHIEDIFLLLPSDNDVDEEFFLSIDLKSFRVLQCCTNVKI